jgi:hypothetical protein
MMEAVRTSETSVDNHFTRQLSQKITLNIILTAVRTSNLTQCLLSTLKVPTTTPVQYVFQYVHKLAVIFLSFIINSFHFSFIIHTAVNLTLVNNKSWSIQTFSFYTFSSLTQSVTHCSWLSHELCSLPTELSPVLLHCTYCISIGCLWKHNSHCVAMTNPGMLCRQKRDEQVRLSCSYADTK